ncbi:interleukin-2 receptor subunit beta [Microcaecilia unicolor]|uniref:Interleukin-2 receptor subunit beta n=1 Tax=Microcaecilia unicolor TaxID=1415580 RepID=A0A6P7X5T6_9AMPH|nr:interleukin-2 receptor subunit beta [Microcaecilia unicolor]
MNGLFPCGCCIAPCCCRMKITEQHHPPHLWLMLLLLFIAGKSQDVPELDCTYDSVATVTCTWTPDHSYVDAHCSITGTVDNDAMRATCDLPSGTIPRSCELILGKNRKDLAMTVGHTMTLIVKCTTGTNRTTEQKVAETLNYKPYYHLMLSPPFSLKISNSSDGYYNLTWRCEHSHYIENWRKYQVRYKPTRHNHWMDPLVIEQEQRWVTIRDLSPDTEYEAEVRVNQTRFSSSRWSQWSHAIMWITPKADFRFSVKKEEDKILHVLVPCLLVGTIITLVVAGFYASKWFKKVLYLHIPDPAKFFNPINSEHGESFQKWLAPPFAPLFFTSTEVLPEISPVEIRPKFVPKELFLPTAPQDTSSHSISSVTNQGYFLNYPNSLKIDSCQIYFTYESFSSESSSSEANLSYGDLHSPGAKDDMPLCSTEVGMEHTTGEIMGLPNYSLRDDPQHVTSDFSNLFLVPPPLALTGNSARGLQVPAENMAEGRNNIQPSHLLLTTPMAMLDHQRIAGEADGITRSDGKGQQQHDTSHSVDGNNIHVPLSMQGHNCCCWHSSLNLVNRDYLTVNELQRQYGSHSV